MSLLPITHRCIRCDLAYWCRDPGFTWNICLFGVNLLQETFFAEPVVDQCSPPQIVAAVSIEE